MDKTYLDFVKPSADGGELSQLSLLAEEQAAATAEVARLEALLETARANLRGYAEQKVPELMDQIGLSEFATASGLRIKIQETIRASIPKAAAFRAFAWLRENGHAAMIKRTLSVALGKGEEERAEKLHAMLDAEFEVSDVENVHPSTLAAFVREKLQEGEEVPIDLFGVYRQRVSKLN